jgi:hypothetical protein
MELKDEVKVIKWSSSPMMETEGSGRKLKRGEAQVADGSVFQGGGIPVDFQGEEELPGRGLSVRSPWWCLFSSKINGGGKSKGNAVGGGVDAKPAPRTKHTASRKKLA